MTLPPGLDIVSVNDLSRNDADGFPGIVKKIMEGLAGDPSVPIEDKNAFAALFASQLKEGVIEAQEFAVPIGSEVCLGKAFRDPDNKGFPMNKEKTALLVEFELQTCVTIGGPPSLAVKAGIEINFVVIYDKKTPIAEKNVTIVFGAGIAIKLDATTLSLEAFLFARLKAASQVWANPFGRVSKFRKANHPPIGIPSFKI